MTQLLLATRNRGKVQELSDLLSDMPELEVLCLDDIPDPPEVVEDGDTFEANAAKKAQTLAEHSGLLTLADDSGLEVDALGGRPGVRSARYAGQGASDQENNDKLLAELGDTEERGARFRCVLALAKPGQGVVHTVNGVCEGRILPGLRGKGGFGYDPLFQPAGQVHTMAELGSDDKNAISHRGRATRRMVTYLKALMARPSSPDPIPEGRA